jgi:hypothetical protein
MERSFRVSAMTVAVTGVVVMAFGVAKAQPPSGWISDRTIAGPIETYEPGQCPGSINYFIFDNQSGNPPVESNRPKVCLSLDNEGGCGLLVSFHNAASGSFLTLRVGVRGDATFPNVLTQCASNVAAIVVNSIGGPGDIDLYSRVDDAK